jgi:hypothetical protein
MPRTGTPSLAHGCQLTACLSLQRARVERRGFAKDFRALESFRLAMIWRADRRGRIVCDANGNSQARPGKTPVDREVGHAPSPLRGSILAVAAVWRPPNRFPLRPTQWEGEGQGEVGPMLCAQHQKHSPGITERTLALLRRAKYPHCSACARDGLISLPPLHSVPLRLHRFRLHCTAFRSRQI